DLDLPTLSVLENFLSDYPGCLIIVSHDRYFMDRVVDHLFVFEGRGVIRDFPGNYSDDRIAHKAESKQDDKPKIEPVKDEYVDSKSVEKKKKRSYKEQREFEQLEKEIPDLENEKTAITEQMSAEALAYETLQKLSNRINEITQLLEEKELRWLELSEYT